jgi:hypothetical protein
MRRIADLGLNMGEEGEIHEARAAAASLLGSSPSLGFLKTGELTESSHAAQALTPPRPITRQQHSPDSRSFRIRPGHRSS